MGKGKAFDRPLAVAVEGIDFLHLLRTQFNCEKQHLDFWLYDFFEDRADRQSAGQSTISGNNLKRWVSNFKKQAEESSDFKPRTLAVIRDAEDDAVAQFEAVHAALEAAGLPRPDHNGQFATGLWKKYPDFRVGVLIIPADGASGCLETCLLRAPRVTHAMEPAKKFLEEVEVAIRSESDGQTTLDRKTTGGLARWREKVRVRSMIAGSPDDPGQNLGTSGTWLWDFSREPLKRMIDFINEARR